jgi:MoxR-like ATPase
MRRQKRGKRWPDDDDEYYEGSYKSYQEEAEERRGEDERWSDEEAAGDYNSLVDETVDAVRNAVIAAIQKEAWNATVLDDEKRSEGSCWPYRGELQAAVERVGENLIERDEESRLLVLGMVAGEHILFLGPPGTAKSALGRRLSKLCGGLFFQRLLTRFTTPEEIFGPLSLTALENDEYRRCTTGFLPTASVAFLDEIFKANSAILNTLLTILNERQFDNGGTRETCPIRCVVGASNELPESDELDALYDRFLLRKEVLPVSDEGLIKILSLMTPGASPCDYNDDVSIDGYIDSLLDKNCNVPFSDGLDRVIHALSSASKAVHVTDDAAILMRDLRRFMRDELDVQVSDRRLVKAARLLRFSAASHGRTSVDPIDFLLLQHVVWRLPEHRSTVREWLFNHLTPSGVPADSSSSVALQFRLLLESLRREAVTAVRKTGGDITGAAGGRAADIRVIEAVCLEIGKVSSIMKQRLDILARHTELLRRSMDHLWLCQDESLSVQQLLLPQAEAASMQLFRALADSRALELVLSDGPLSPPNDLRLSVIESLGSDDVAGEIISFTEEELNIGMKEAKIKYDPETFRKWKRARKKANK